MQTKEDIKIIGNNEYMGLYQLKPVKGEDGKLHDGMEAYEIVRGEEAALRFSVFSKQLRYIMGEVLTTLEAVMADERQLKATKSLIKKQFSAQLSWVYELCGIPEEEEASLMNPDEE